MRQSIRLKLTLLFLLTIILPIVLIVVELPAYYVKSIKEQQSSLMAGTLAALTSHIETYLDDLDRMTVTPYFYDDVMRAMKLKSTYGWNLLTPFEQFEAGQTLSTTLPNALRNTRKDILGTILLPMDGSVYVSSSSNLTGAVDRFPFTKQDWYIKALRADGDVAFISVHDQNYLNGARANVFSVARLIKDPDSRRPLGVIMADADTVAIERMIDGIGLSNGALAAILDDNGKLIYASGPAVSGLRAQLASGAGYVHAPGDDYHVVSKTIARSQWGIYVMFPETAVRRQLDRVYDIGIWFAAGGLVVALILYTTVSHWMVTPFKRMIQTMKRVQRGDMGAFYPVKGNDEVAQLGTSLNTMISRLGELIDREYRAVLGQRNAEYHALQSQIQPHFLYNTLNGFIGLNRSGQSALLERAILSLGGMLRYTLDKNERASLKDEMEFVEKYCELQQLRFTDKMEFEIDFSPEVYPMLIPKLLLQPLVENAVIHGIEPCKSSCLLRIEAHVARSNDFGRDDDRLIITVSDNGIGFDPGTGRSGVGVTNVRERLKLAFEHASFSMRSVPGQGTEAVIQIPLKDVDLA
ncbi:cache domain-containing sensor histidine kinase [Paenibacillus sacheonensis]|uniref:HAMP domain-containing protein n=1 Tax=Paenibacillus sacheonensis TaxID=742054 RepID=A0A7X5BVB3_9BACL|nr:sensor histidine kinase [Paenibacillus sacheonensis]MBM7563215.1 two-component system sensor histidine kinase YesM [Paenibacillus sacheonensis]NBC68223.1 HAMP domain-containing protein [Paenibacillus sacheonensis]